MSRSIWKGPFLDKFLLKHRVKKLPKIIWSRRSVIPFIYLNKQVSIYNGKIFKRIFITREKIGFKFGMFVFTRKYSKSKKLKKKKK